MQRTSFWSVAASFLLFCTGGVLLASEVDELRQRAKARRHEASVMAQQGKPDQAERLEQEALKLLAAAERMEHAESESKETSESAIDKEVRYLKSRLQELMAQEKKLRAAKAPEPELALVREQIEQTERELHRSSEPSAEKAKLPPQFQMQAEKLAAAAKRVHHFRLAAQNLKLAEAHDLAHQLMEKAEAMEHEVQEGKQKLMAEMHHGQGKEHGPDVVHQLKREIERLRAEVQQLRQKLESR